MMGFAEVSFIKKIEVLQGFLVRQGMRVLHLFDDKTQTQPEIMPITPSLPCYNEV